MNVYLFIFVLLFLSQNDFSIAQEVSQRFSYKLAVIHMRAVNPENSLLNSSLEPSGGLVAEFHWIMETLQNNCINPEVALADTLVETWQKAKNIGYTGSLLEISRELSVDARNYKLAGGQKVNFRMTSAHWLDQLQIRMKTPPNPLFSSKRGKGGVQ